MRAFVAIDLPEFVKQQVLGTQRTLQEALQDARIGDTVRWTAASNLHLTLRFLGETAPVQARQLSDALTVTVRAHPVFTLHLGRLGCFPNFGRPAIVWLDVQGQQRALLALQQAAEAVVQEMGFPAEERPFTPHLTIGRMQRTAPVWAMRQVGELLRQWAERQPAAASTFEVNQILLMQSELRPQGSLHTVLERFALGGNS